MADAAELISPDRLLCTAAEAAELLGLSLSTFRRHVAEDLPRVPVGARVLYDPEDLRRWRDKQKVGPSAETPAPRCTSSAGAAPVAAITDRRALEIEQQLRRSLRRSSRGSTQD